MVWQIGHDFDVEAGKANTFTRCPMLEMSSLLNDQSKKLPIQNQEMKNLQSFLQNSIDYAKGLESPRYIKTHLPLPLLNPEVLNKAKVIWAARNPKDTMLSLFHHEKLIPHHGLKRDGFDEFFELFLKGEVVYGDYWNYMRLMWPYKDHPNVKVRNICLYLASLTT